MKRLPECTNVTSSFGLAARLIKLMKFLFSLDNFSFIHVRLCKALRDGESLALDRERRRKTQTKMKIKSKQKTTNNFFQKVNVYQTVLQFSFQPCMFLLL